MKTAQQLHKKYLLEYLADKSDEVKELKELIDNTPIIVQNAIEICATGEILNSVNRHDFISHTFPNDKFIAVDGGRDYIKRSGSFDVTNTLYRELTIDFNTPISEIRAKLLWGTRGKNGKQPLTYKKIKDLELDHLKAILKNVKNISPLHKQVIKYWVEKKKNKKKQKRLKKNET